LVRDFFFRSCADRVGEGVEQPEVESIAFDVGPLSFPALDIRETAMMAAPAFEPGSDGRYQALMYVTVVDGTALGPIDLWVDPLDRGYAGLLYDPVLWNEGTLAAADHTVRFEGCPGVDAQFNGGFLVTRPICLSITVIQWGRDAPLVSFGSIPFGVSSDVCPLPNQG
jgi:hypothetical protein